MLGRPVGVRTAGGVRTVDVRRPVGVRTAGGY